MTGNSDTNERIQLRKCADTEDPVSPAIQLFFLNQGLFLRLHEQEP